MAQPKKVGPTLAKLLARGVPDPINPPMRQPLWDDIQTEEVPGINDVSPLYNHRAELPHTLQGKSVTLTRIHPTVKRAIQGHIANMAS